MKNKEVINKYFLGEKNPFYGKKHTKETLDFLRNENLGERCPAYIDGRTLKQYYCKLCGNPISVYSALHRRGICKECKHKLHSAVMKGHKNNPKGPMSFNFKGGKPKCIDCGKELQVYNAIRCRACNGKAHSIRMSGENSPFYGKVATHSKGDYYKGIWMRSSWEIAYAKWLDKKDIKWLYEPKAFKVSYRINGNIKNGTYRPDFYLPETDEYIEIKGWWRGDALDKFNAFIKEYPEINTEVLRKEALVLRGVLK